MTVLRTVVLTIWLITQFLAGDIGFEPIKRSTSHTHYWQYFKYFKFQWTFLFDKYITIFSICKHFLILFLTINILAINYRFNRQQLIYYMLEATAGFEPAMEFSLTRLTVWTFRPTKATKPLIKSKLSSKVLNFDTLLESLLNLSRVLESNQWMKFCRLPP